MHTVLSSWLSDTLCRNGKLNLSIAIQLIIITWKKS